MVGVQDAASLDDVEAILRFLAPWQLEHPVQVIADPTLLGILFAGALEPLKLALDLFAHLVRKRCVDDLLAVLGQCVAVGIAQFLLDGRQLLAQIELALAFFEAFVDLNSNFVFE